MADLKRIFSVGYHFEDGRTENAEFHEPDSSLGHDLIYWDPSGLPNDYQATGTITRVLKGLPARQFERDRKRRSAEFHEHLRAGKPIVVAIPPPQLMLVKKTESESSVWNLADPLSLLPEEPEMQAARGKAFELITDGDFAKLWEWTEEVATYEGYFDAPPGIPLLRIEGTDKVVATAVQVESGVVIWMPRLNPIIEYVNDDDSRTDVLSGENAAHKDFLDLLWAACQQFGRRGVGPDLSLPQWTTAVHIPGEKVALERRDRAEGRLKSARKAIDKQNQRLDELQERKVLLAGTGSSLERIVDEALCALGFEVEPGLPGRTDRIIRLNKRVAVVEIKGKAKSASERDAAQLEKWKSDFHAAHGKVPKGILVVNAWRSKPLDERSALTSFPDQMLPYAVEQRQQCLVTGLQLLGLWLEAESHPKAKAKLARSLLGCVGVYPNYEDWRDIVSLAAEKE